MFWQVGSSATLGNGTAFVGSILALTSDTVTTSSSVDGRVFALNGAVTLDDNAITVPSSGGERHCTFITGGGFITAPSGGKTTFGFEAGCRVQRSARARSLRGEVVYQDHSIGLKVKSTDITAYIDLGRNSRRIQGAAEINGQAGKFELDATDDEAGTDRFAMGHLQRISRVGLASRRPYRGPSMPQR